MLRDLRERVEDWFTYHSPSGDQVLQMQEIRELAYQLASKIADVEMDYSDKMAALRRLREATMTANAGIIFNEKPKSTKEKLDLYTKVINEQLDELHKSMNPPILPHPLDWPPITDPIRGCVGCRGPVWIAGPWTCSVCGTRYQNESHIATAIPGGNLRPGSTYYVKQDADYED